MSGFLNFIASTVSQFGVDMVGALPAFLVESGTGPFGIDTSIEGMKSQQFSVGIFYFLIAAIVVFTVFVFLFMFKDKASKLKTGEKWLFGWILLGVVVAVIFGATQMLQGYLF